MAELTYNEYWKEIKSIAADIVSEAIDQVNDDDGKPEMFDFDDIKDQAENIINDYLLHETIDGHQWVIYYAYNLDVIKNTNNADYYVDNFGNDELAFVLKSSGLNLLHTAIAYWCMYADVQDNLDGAFNDYENNI